MNAISYSCVAPLLALLLLAGSTYAIDVTSVTIMDATTDVAIGTISDGDVLNLDFLPSSIAFRADADATTGSVQFQFTGAESSTRIDNSLPYSSHGDATGDFQPWNPGAGSYTMTVTPYQYGGATGSAGTPQVINFTVTFDPAPVSPTIGTGAFLESGGLVVMETESEAASGNWSYRFNNAGYTGSGFYVWKFADDILSTSPAGSDPITYEIEITTTGRYKFEIRSAAPDQNDHNDVWIRFPDNGAEAVKGTGGFSLGTGWFKVYQNVDNNTWTWTSVTKDFDPHQIYVDFDSPGLYRMELGGRSSLFQIDRVILFHSTVSSSTAQDLSNPESVRVGSPPPPAACPTPQNPNAVISSSTAATILYDPVTGSDGYQIQGRVAGTTEWANRYSTTTGNFFTFFDPGQSYEWRVRSACNSFADTSEYTAIQTFTMPTARLTELDTEQLDVFPNPATAGSMISVNTPEGTGALEIRDFMGRAVSRWFKGEGNHQLSLDDLAPGNYWIRAVDQSGEAIQSSQIVIVQ